MDSTDALSRSRCRERRLNNRNKHNVLVQQGWHYILLVILVSLTGKLTGDVGVANYSKNAQYTLSKVSCNLTDKLTRRNLVLCLYIMPYRS